MQLDIDGVLDLHHFKPREVPDLVREYLHECRRRDIAEVRIVHGKGKGVLRAIVQDILAQDPHVLAYGPAMDRSGWGATVARLHTARTPPSPRTAETGAAVERKRFWQKLWPWRRN
ncbi:Smr/MutS family protein [Acidihalobacter prosperus]|uniref:Recombination inhibitory protein MutS2 n=1 Tax=Acidihalobacter prosperus TaxID=160660 RepID=A0A1A6C7M6_9GAMM|nr:Smr/MutS family protein [Acidihalobacter prosperus]OBS10549.1 Recombination inhibitory protein MutS2 [Acidihalobacter prosperus]